MYRVGTIFIVFSRNFPINLLAKGDLDASKNQTEPL